MKADQETPDPRIISPRPYRGYAVAPAFEWLLLGDVRPEGWIREQMSRDLESGFAGSLNRLCREASSDIFTTGRNSASTRNSDNERGVNWWNGETEGNWRAGQIMLSYLAGHHSSISEAQEFVRHILASQESSGYLGIFSPELRFGFQGELWAQACLLRGLLAYSELTGDKSVLAAIQRAVDLVIRTYGIEKQPLVFGETRDWMICDVLENLDYLTGEPGYREFALWLYDTWNRNEPDADAAVSSLLDLERGFVGHGVHTYENLRVPLWLAMTSGREDLAQASRNALTKIQRYTELSGSAVSQEWIQDKSPDPDTTEYEYCPTKELQATFTSALQKFGDAPHADRVEHRGSMPHRVRASRTAVPSRI